MGGGKFLSYCQKTLQKAFVAHRQHRVFDLRGPTSKYPLSLILISSSLPRYIGFVLFPYCFRFRKRERQENDRRMIRERYGIDTGLIRDRYVVDTRTIFPDTQQRKLIRSLTFSLLFWCIIFYILLFRCVLPLVQRWLGCKLPQWSNYTKITFRLAECKLISMN